MRRRRRAIWWTPALVAASWLAVPGAAWPGLHGEEEPPSPPPAEAPVPTEPETAPGGERSDEQFERLPGRDDPDEFYRKPPRKPRERTKMYA